MHTAAGSFTLIGDVPSNYIAQVDQLLGEIFNNNPAVTDIEFSGAETRPGHTATPDDLHRSTDGAAYVRIDAAVARGEHTNPEAIAAYPPLADEHKK